jgi:hypothetical protein
MNLEEEIRKLNKIAQLTKTLLPMLKLHGSSDEVLSACLMIAAASAKRNGKSIEEFMRFVHGLASVVYEKEGLMS